MTAFWVRALLSGLIIALASTLARRQPSLGALIVALPLVSVTSMIWLWRDDPNPQNMAAYVQGIFWYILATMPMFLAIPWLLRRGLHFWPSLLAGCLLTLLLYAAMVTLLARAGIRL